MPDPRVRRRSTPPLRTSTRLVLDRVALTDSPSNPEALVFFARSISNTSGVPVNDAPPVDESVTRQIEEAKAAMKAEFEAANRARDEEIAALRADKLARDEDVSRSQCGDTASVFRNIGADGVKLGDLIYRTRKAAKLAGDTALETDLIAVLRAADARAKAGGTAALTENRGSGAEGGDAAAALSSFTPATRSAIEKHLTAGVSLTTAMRSAARDAAATGKDDAVYSEIAAALTPNSRRA